MFGLKGITKELATYLTEAEKAVKELERISDNPEALRHVQTLKGIIDKLKNLASKYGVKI